MIRPTKKLLKWIDTFGNKERLAEALGVDYTTLWRVLSGNQTASTTLIEAFHNLNRWSMSEAWEVVNDVNQ